MPIRVEKNVRSVAMPAKEQVFFGRCERRGAPVVGRLVFDGSSHAYSGKEALLAVIGGEASEPLLVDGRTVGVVRISESCEGFGDLFCPSITLPALPRECGGRIALLDPLSERLFVSPDIVTVNRYAPLALPRSVSDQHPPLVLPSGRRVELRALCDGAALPSHSFDGYILRPFGAEGEEELYGRYRDIAEGAVGQAVTAMLSARREPEPAMRALMRSAVWGEVSLLLCDILTEAELSAALGVLHRVFCELEGEGREFNGYLPRGLCIDTPYLLSRMSALGGIDFFVYDIERTARLLCGERRDIPSEVITKLCGDICEAVRARRDVRHSVILGRGVLCPELCRALLECGISEYAAPVECLDAVYGMMGE